jgi:hypothetical protein
MKRNARPQAAKPRRSGPKSNWEHEKPMKMVGVSKKPKYKGKWETH